PRSTLFPYTTLFRSPPHPEVRRERHLPHRVGKRRLGQRPVPFPPRRSDRRERERLRLGYEQPAHPGVLVPVKAGPSPLSRQLPGHVSYAVTVQGEGLRPPWADSFQSAFIVPCEVPRPSL